MNNIIGKKSIFYYPEGLVSFDKFEAVFSEVSNQIVFSVCIDGGMYINESYQLVPDPNSAALFGKKNYSSIHARVAAVYTSICEGKIKPHSVNNELYQCSGCDKIMPISTVKDAEDDGDVCGTCPSCGRYHIFYPFEDVDEN